MVKKSSALYGGTGGSSQRLNHSSRKVNTLSTCCLLQQVVQHNRRLPAFQLFHAGGPWYSGIYAASPPFNHRGLTDKLIVGLGSPQLLIPLQHNTSQSMKLQYNAWAAKKRGVLACWATGRNLLLLASTACSSLQLLVGRNRAAQIKKGKMCLRG